MQLEKTGVFVTKEEKEDLLKQADQVARTPVMGFSMAHMERGGFAGDARESLLKRVHSMAMERGLPDFEGYYGIDQDGEFVRPKP